VMPQQLPQGKPSMPGWRGHRAEGSDLLPHQNMPEPTCAAGVGDDQAPPPALPQGRLGIFSRLVEAEPPFSPAAMQRAKGCASALWSGRASRDLPYRPAAVSSANGYNVRFAILRMGVAARDGIRNQTLRASTSRHARLSRRQCRWASTARVQKASFRPSGPRSQQSPWGLQICERYACRFPVQFAV
jgi:hypothetical protein